MRGSMRSNRWLGLGFAALFAALFITSLPVQYPLAVAQEQQQNVLETGAAAIKEANLKDSLKVIAGKEMVGRGTLNGGYKKASDWLEKQLKDLGLAPKGDLLAARMTNNECREVCGYFQNFTFEEYGRGEAIASRNVLAALEGEKKDEWVILGSHYDHVGIGETGVREDDKVGQIHYGADDNGSGTVANLEVARAFSELAKSGKKPKRSILFCWWGAEEWGEHGSLYFMKHPPKGMDLEKIVGYINMDMVGRNDPKEVFVLCAPVTVRTQKEAVAETCKDLYELAESVNTKLKLEFEISHRDTVFGFERTDGWSVYQKQQNGGKRIPVWELFTGEHADYHTPRDTWDRIDYGKLTRVAKLAFGLAWQIAEADTPPSYQK